MPFSDEQVAAGSVVVGERPLQYSYPAIIDGDIGDPRPGTPVVTADGEALGTVGEVESDRFQVSVPLAPDYWLPSDIIDGVGEGGDLVLSVTKAELSDVKMDDAEMR